MNYKVHAPNGELTGNVLLPVSKSIFNRYLILRFLSGNHLPVFTEGYPEDVNRLIGVLSSDQSDLYFGDAGTAMRFGTALFSTIEGKRTLSGSARMRDRPIGGLVDSLKKLGAEIKYIDKAGYPPLSVRGKKLQGGSIIVPANVSSQYVSALLMIAPVCKAEVRIELSGDIVSYPYIKMTIALMKKMGVEVEESKNTFIIQPQSFGANQLDIESDWSSASFIYQIAALSNRCNILLSNLQFDSIQGDRACISLFEKLGVKSMEESKGIRIIKDQDVKIESELIIDFTEIPDLVQPFTMTCAVLGIDLNATGLYNLHIKETDRLKAIQFNVESLGGEFNIYKTSAFLKAPKELNTTPGFKVFNDHRMAMSLAPLSLKLKEVVVEDTGVVKKSFPDYWKEVRKLGFEMRDFL